MRKKNSLSLNRKLCQSYKISYVRDLDIFYGIIVRKQVRDETFKQSKTNLSVGFVCQYS